MDYNEKGKARDENLRLSFFLYVVYQSFRLCYRRSIQKKEYRRADKYHSQYAVKPACLPAAYIPYDKLRVLGGKEPIPI